jgi:hypothetical protein
MSHNYHPIKHSSTDTFSTPQNVQVKKVQFEETTEASKKSDKLQIRPTVINKAQTGGSEKPKEGKDQKEDKGNRSSISSGETGKKKNKKKNDKSLLGDIAKSYLSDNENYTNTPEMPVKIAIEAYGSAQKDIDSSDIDSDRVAKMKIPSRRISRIEMGKFCIKY